MLKPKLKPKQLTRLADLVRLGMLDFRQGKFLEAVNTLQPAVTMVNESAHKHPNYLKALDYLAKSLLRTGDTQQALQRQAQLLALIPQDSTAKANLLSMLRASGGNTPPGTAFQAAVVKALEGANPADYVFDLVNLLLADPAFNKIAGQIVVVANENSLVTELLHGDYELLLENPLLHKLLSSTAIPLPDFERLFRKLRKALLQVWSRKDWAASFQEFADKQKHFLAHLAHYLWITEYAFFVDPEEYQLLTELESCLEKSIAEFAGLDAAILSDLSIFALYTPWLDLQTADTLFEIPLAAWPDYLQNLLQEWHNYREEQRLKPNIPALTDIGHGLTAEVRRQYEENPYPRWQQPPVTGSKRNLATRLAQLTPGFLPPARFHEPVDILVAGCGTGYLVFKIAAEIEAASLLAVDLSLSSLAYASRMAKDLQVECIEFAQADILQLATLERRFDFIVCTGVLHHLEEPMAGWRILTDLLRPGGIMFIALYSEIARQPLVKARNLIEARSLPATTDAMRRLRMEILENQHPDLKVLLNWLDFYSLSMFRDMAFHVNEHLFTWPKIKAALTELDLSLLALVRVNPEIMTAYRRRFPDDLQAINLDNWALFETQNSLTFINMYSFYVCKN